MSAGLLLIAFAVTQGMALICYADGTIPTTPLRRRMLARLAAATCTAAAMLSAMHLGRTL